MMRAMRASLVTLLVFSQSLLVVVGSEATFPVGAPKNLEASTEDILNFYIRELERIGSFSTPVAYLRVALQSGQRLQSHVPMLQGEDFNSLLRWQEEFDALLEKEASKNIFELQYSRYESILRSMNRMNAYLGGLEQQKLLALQACSAFLQNITAFNAFKREIQDKRNWNWRARNNKRERTDTIPLRVQFEDEYFWDHLSASFNQQLRLVGIKKIYKKRNKVAGRRAKQ